MSGWPLDIKMCKNCKGEPSRYAYRARGYCSRCYRLIRHIEKVQAWDRSRRETLKKPPKDGMFDPAVGYGRSNRLITDGFTQVQFEVCRTETIRQLEDRLALLRHREEIRRLDLPVDGLSLEQKFAELLHMIQPKAEYPTNASYLNANFNEAERRVIYALLEEIIEQAPWSGVDWMKISERVFATGK
jgi:hypothetical protein